MPASTLEVGKKLVELCRQGKNVEAVEKLYAPNIVSIETMSHPGMPARMEGIDAIKGKNQWWMDNHEVHSGQTNGPWPHGDRFIVHFNFDVTPKAGPMAGKRMKMEEAALYTVKDGKITQEEFFYYMGA
jgi:ketosteroid isomerase-like protein